MLKGKPIIMHGDGNSIWAECHSDDVAVAFANAIGCVEAYGRAFHVAGEEWMTFRQMWEIAAEVLGAPTPNFVQIPTDLLYCAMPELAAWRHENFKYNNIFDNNAARQVLGFRYTIPWAQGFRRYVEYTATRGEAFENSDSIDWYDQIIDAWRITELSFCKAAKV